VERVWANRQRREHDVMELPAVLVDGDSKALLSKTLVGSREVRAAQLDQGADVEGGPAHLDDSLGQVAQFGFVKIKAERALSWLVTGREPDARSSHSRCSKGDGFPIFHASRSWSPLSCQTNCAV